MLCSHFKASQSINSKLIRSVWGFEEVPSCFCFHLYSIALALEVCCTDDTESSYHSIRKYSGLITASSFVILNRQHAQSITKIQARNVINKASNLNFSSSTFIQLNFCIILYRSSFKFNIKYVHMTLCNETKSTNAL